MRSRSKFKGDSKLLKGKVCVFCFSLLFLSLGPTKHQAIFRIWLLDEGIDVELNGKDIQYSVLTWATHWSSQWLWQQFIISLYPWCSVPSLNSSCFSPEKKPHIPSCCSLTSIIISCRPSLSEGCAVEGSCMYVCSVVIFSF